MTWQNKLSTLITDLYDYAASQSSDPLVASVQELSHGFNDLRRFRRDDYFSQAWARSAYLGYFAPKNIARLAFLLDLLEREGHLADLPQQPHVVDLGAGPLVGSLAFHTRFAQPGTRFFAVDQSRQMLKLGRDFFNAQFPSEAQLKTISGNLKAPAKNWGPREPADLILVANVLNEFGEPRRSLKAREVFLDQLRRFLKPQGYLLLVEPAQRVASQGLSLLRDSWRGGKDLHLLAPCMALETCPMGPRAPTWCHTSFQWRHPAKLFQLIQKLGFQANPLSLSYSLWQRNSKVPRNKGVRLVSDVMGQKGASQQLMACDHKNELIRIPMKKFIDLPSPARGQWALSLDTKQWAIK
ncbi:MAG: hypothetical protein CMH56_14865 [Myxococcales bacterium]|nr:hypothetical protein [Myxococcales bacterium]|tara:strand:+ start:6156 stop:7217 length:1062 start_codon:yes stop_codon:yes gene_type:complete